MKSEKNFMTRKQYLELPRKDWHTKKQYTAIIVVPTYEIHDSGFRLMALVGCGDDNKPYEIAATCDDICWDTPEGYMAMDCDMFPDNIIRFHSIAGCVFEIGESLSSTHIRLIPKKGLLPNDYFKKL
jgi:hypothetical protein